MLLMLLLKYLFLNDLWRQTFVKVILTLLTLLGEELTVGGSNVK